MTNFLLKYVLPFFVGLTAILALFSIIAFMMYVLDKLTFWDFIYTIIDIVLIWFCWRVGKEAIEYIQN